MRRAVNRVLVPVAALLAFPAIAVAERVRRGSGRRVARRCVAVVARMCGVRFELVGAHHLLEVDAGTHAGRGFLHQPRAARFVFVPNHSSLVDVPALLLTLGDVRFVAAADLYDNRLLAMAMRALGAVPIDRNRRAGAREQLAAVAAAASADGASLVVFAEGGIAPAGTRLPFKSGAFALALELGVPVVPVAVKGSADVLPPGSGLAVRPGAVTVEVLAPIPTAGLGARDRIALRDRTEAAVRDALARVPAGR